MCMFAAKERLSLGMILQCLRLSIFFLCYVQLLVRLLCGSVTCHGDASADSSFNV